MRILLFILMTAGFVLLELNADSLNETADKDKPNIITIVTDDLTFRHIGAYGCEFIQTPHLDQLAKEGVVFENAYSSSPSCTPSRGALLTGKNGWELEEGAVLQGYLPKKFTTLTEILNKQGYHTGFTGKGWGPGAELDRKENPAGKAYNDIIYIPSLYNQTLAGVSEVDYLSNFKRFLEEKKSSQPYSFWIGTFEPHRPYGTMFPEQMIPTMEELEVPPYLPPTESVQLEMQGYAAEIHWIDHKVGELVKLLKERGEYDNTIIIFTSDNGMPFPRAKMNVYDDGVHIPLLVSWPNHNAEFRARLKQTVSLSDVTPTLLSALGLDIPSEMTGRDLLPVLSDLNPEADKRENDFVCFFRERHAWQPGGTTDPLRGIRKDSMLLVWNLNPNSDCEVKIPQYPTARAINNLKDDEGFEKYFEWSFGKRPEYELFNLNQDAYCLHNLAADSAHLRMVDELSTTLQNYLVETGDLRMKNEGHIYQNAPFFGFVFRSVHTWNARNASERSILLKQAYEYNEEMDAYNAMIEQMDAAKVKLDGRLAF